MSPETFANRFKEAREKKNTTIKALQPLVGASPSAMNGYATGKNLPPLEVAIKIANELGVSLDWLCGLSNTTSSSIQIENCADVAAVIDAVVDRFRNATIEALVDDNSVDYGGELHYFTDIRIESKALFQYYQKMESTRKFLHNLPTDMRKDFLPYKEVAETQERKKLASAPYSETGLTGFEPIEVDELPF